jgi:hypothetical protein
MGIIAAFIRVLTGTAEENTPGDLSEQPAPPTTERFTVLLDAERRRDTMLGVVNFCGRNT